MADTKLSALTATTSPATTDLVYVVTDPGGTPASKKCTIANLKTTMGVTGHSYVGYNSVGSSQETVTQNRWLLKKITLASAAMVMNIAAHIRVTSDAIVGAGVGILADNAGSPSYIIATNTQPSNYDFLPAQTAGAGNKLARWVHIPLSVYLAAGDYWLAWACLFGNTATQIYYDTSGTDRYYTAGGRWFSDAEYYTVTTGSNKYSIRASVIS